MLVLQLLQRATGSEVRKARACLCIGQEGGRKIEAAANEKRRFGERGRKEGEVKVRW